MTKLDERHHQQQVSLKKAVLPAKPRPFRVSGSVFDLTTPQNRLSSSWYELRRHLAGVSQQWVYRSQNSKTHPIPISTSDKSESDTARDANDTLSSVNLILKRASSKILERGNKNGSWNASYLGGATHSALRIISLHYLDADESPKKTQLAILDLLSLQQESGGYGIYPVGPRSKAVSRLSYLALICAMNSNNGILYQNKVLRTQVENSLKKTRRFIQQASDTKEWLLYTLLADFCWQRIAPKLKTTLPQLPFLSNIVYFIAKQGGLGWFQSVLHQTLPSILLLFQPEFSPTDLTKKNQNKPNTRTTPYRWLRRHFFLQEEKLSQQLEQQIIESQDGDGAWVETIVATSLNVMALKKRGYSSNHPALKKAIHYLQQSAVCTNNTITINWAKGDMWDTAIHADILHFINDTDPQEIIRRIYPHMMMGFRSDGRWSFSILGRITDNDSSSMTLATFSHLYQSMNEFQQHNAQPIIVQVVDALLNHQQRDGGWSTFDEQGIHRMGYKTPSPEKGAFFDFSSPDVTGRVIFGLLAATTSGALTAPKIDCIHTAIHRATAYFSVVQSKKGFSEGSYWSRWLLGPIAGTCFVTVALRAASVSLDDPTIKRARAFILRTQHASTGGWGETREADCHSDDTGQSTPTPLQTALALMILIATHQGNGNEKHDKLADQSIERAVTFLLAQQTNGHWEDKWPLGTILTGLDYFITPENSEVAILASLVLYRLYKAQGSDAAITAWVKRPFSHTDTIIE